MPVSLVLDIQKKEIIYQQLMAFFNGKVDIPRYREKFSVIPTDIRKSFSKRMTKLYISRKRDYVNQNQFK